MSSNDTENQTQSGKLIDESQPENKGSSKKKMTWVGLGFMGFTCVWGFGNVINGFGYFGGTHAIVPWIVVFGLYFLPYSLIVGELGSVFKKSGGGVTSWVYETIGPKVAYFCGWIYWVVHLPYISQKPNNFLVSLSWVVFQDDRISNFNVGYVQLACLGVFIVALLIALRGINFIKKISGIAGTSMFIMSLLYILLIWTAPLITGRQLNTIELKLENFIPQDPTVFLNMSILIFGVGGCEKISPYVNQMRKPGKDFPQGMIFLAIMVAVCAVLGSLAMGMMYDSSQLSNSDYQTWFIAQGQYDAFKQLGNYYGLGNSVLIIYSLCNAISFFAVLMISIDAPLKILLSTVDKKFVPRWWFKQNKHGAYVNGFKVVALVVALLTLLPAVSIGDVNQFVKWLLKLNSVCMPLRYLFVFVAYIGFKLHADKFTRGEYIFIKNKKLAILVGGWCFGLTFVCCLMGMFNSDPVLMAMNILTPVVLLAIGLVLPWRVRSIRNNELAHK